MSENLPSYSLKSYGIQLEAAIGRTVGMYSYYTKSNNRMGSRHTLSFVAPVFDRVTYSKWASWFTRLNVSYNPFKFCPYRERIPVSDCLTEAQLSDVVNSSSSALDVFSKGNVSEVKVGHNTTGTGGAWAYQTATLEEDEFYVLTFHASVNKGVFSTTTDNEFRVTVNDTSEATAAALSQVINEGWNEFTIRGQSDGTHWIKYYYEATSKKAEFTVSNWNLQKITVDTSFVSRLNKEQAANGTSSRDFDTFVANSSTVVPGYGTAVNAAITTTSVNERAVYFPIQNLLSDANSMNSQPWYKVSFNLTVNSGTLGTSKVAFAASTSTTLTSTADYYADVSSGVNTAYIKSDVADYGYLAIQVADSSAVDISITDLKVHKMSINPEVDDRTDVASVTAVNAVGAAAFGSFTLATATGFTASHDGTGASGKFAYVPLTLTSTNPHLITFDIVKNSGTHTLGHLTLYWVNSGSLDSSPACSLSSTDTTVSVILTPDGDDDGLAFFINAGFSLNFTVSNFKVVELPVYGTDTVAARSTLQLTGPADEIEYLGPDAYIELPNTQLIKTGAHLVTNNTGHSSVQSLPILRSTLTTGYECKVFCPEGLFIVEKSTTELSNRLPGGVYDEISVTAIEYIDQ